MSSAVYDGNGMRTAAAFTPAGGSTATGTYVWNGDRLLMDSANAYIYSDSLYVPAEQVSLATGTITYLVADALGSVRGTVNSAGALTGSTSYDAWGNPQTSGGLMAITPFGYAGGYTDPDGLIYFVNRYYDSAVGQFISLDPAVSTTRQPYAYANDDPVNRTDPEGLMTLGICAGAGAILYHAFQIAGGVCLQRTQFTRSDDIGLTRTVFADYFGAGTKWSFSVNSYYEASTATTLQQLNGYFDYYDAGMPTEYIFGINAMVFWGSNGVLGVDFGLSFGPRTAHVGAGISYTWVNQFRCSGLWKKYCPGPNLARFVWDYYCSADIRDLAEGLLLVARWYIRHEVRLLWST